MDTWIYPCVSHKFLGWLNRSISPISEMIVAAIFPPIPGIDWIILHTSTISSARTSISASILDRCSTPSYSPSYRSGGGGRSSGGSGSSAKPRWSRAGSSVVYTVQEVRALTPIRGKATKLRAWTLWGNMADIHLMDLPWNWLFHVVMHNDVKIVMQPCLPTS